MEKSLLKGPDLDTICLVNLKDFEGKVLCDHIWLTVGKQIKSLDLIVGDMISFEARSKEYLKGYFGRREDVYKEIEIDYKLSNPTKFQKLM